MTCCRATVRRFGGDMPHTRCGQFIGSWTIYLKPARVGPFLHGWEVTLFVRPGRVPSSAQGRTGRPGLRFATVTVREDLQIAGAGSILRECMKEEEMVTCRRWPTSTGARILERRLQEKKREGTYPEISNLSDIYATALACTHAEITVSTTVLHEEKRFMKARILSPARASTSAWSSTNLLPLRSDHVMIHNLQLQAAAAAESYLSNVR